MKVSERLVASQKEVFDSYVNHPFVQGIGKGDLAKEKFQYYLLQDYVYLIDYARVFSIGAAKAKRKETMEVFAAYVHQILSGEMDIHRNYMKRLGITKEEMDNVKASLDNTSYTSYMIRVAYEEGEAELACAILSCAISYEHIAKKLLAENQGADQHEFYGEWIKGYTSEQYHKENLQLMDLLDELTKDYSGKQIEHLEEIFAIATAYEGAFWDMAWRYEHGVEI
ncbi:MAG: thiaminase II [Lachnospiraceae bacterium]|nr:thiaminase II [Lachnospiraceae bacterium]